jgi:hypothetical protein
MSECALIVVSMAQTPVLQGFRGLLMSRRTMLALIVLTPVALVAVYLPALTNNDVAWYLLATRKWLDGARLYHDIIEVNPPLVFYLDIIPVIAARLTGWSAGACFVLYVAALTGFALALIWRISENDAADALLKRAMILAAALGLLFFPASDFGQREHLLLVLSLPYLFLQERRAIGQECRNTLSVTAGVLGGLGFALKPHFLLLPLVTSLYLAWRARRLGAAFPPETATAAVIIGTYALSVPLLTPDYLTRVVPFALLVYNAYASSLADVVLCWQSVALLALVLVHLHTRSRQVEPARTDVILLCCGAAYLAYLAQMKSWTYHLLPVTTLLFLAALAIAVVEPLRRARSGAMPALGVLGLAAMLSLSVLQGAYRNPVAETLLPAARQYAQGSSVFVFSSYVWVGFPLATLADARWPSRFPSLWLLPGAERRLRMLPPHADPALSRDLNEIETYTTDAVIRDMSRDPPGLVVVDERPDPRFGGLPFDYLSYFARDARFRVLWSNYRSLGTVCVGDLGPYVLYARAAASENSRAEEEEAPLLHRDCSAAGES